MTSAASISRLLASAGMRPLPSGTSRNREGVRVKRAVGGGAWVSVDIDSTWLRNERAAEIEAFLLERGFAVTRPDGAGGSLLRVSDGL